MRRSIWHCTLVVIAAVSMTSISTGCRSGGWSMPGSSWVSWGKKKPPTSSIAGTREPIATAFDQRAAVSAEMIRRLLRPPPRRWPAIRRRHAGRCTECLRIVGTCCEYAGFRRATAGGTGGLCHRTVQHGGSGDAASTPTQQGFYRPSAPAGGGPAASTADARGGYAPPATPRLRRRDARDRVIRVPPRTVPRPMPAIPHRPAGTMHRSRPPEPRATAPRNTVPPDAGYPAPDATRRLPGRCPHHRLSIHALQRRLSVGRTGSGPSAEYRLAATSATDVPRRPTAPHRIRSPRRPTATASDVRSRLAIRDLWHEPTAGAHYGPAAPTGRSDCHE